MRQPCRSARFAPQTFAVRRIGREARRQRLERHLPTETLVGGEIHASHPAAAHFALDRIDTDPPAWSEGRGGMLEQFRQLIDDGLREKRAGPRMVFEERKRLIAHPRVVCRLGGDPLQRRGGRLAVESGFE